MTVDPGPLLKEQEAIGLKRDFDKSFLAELTDVQPDVLIVELLYDSQRGVISIDGSWITSTYILHRSTLPEELKSIPELSCREEPERYFGLFREAARNFALFVRNKLPACTIILHQARWSEYFVDEAGDLRAYPPWEQQRYFRSNLRLISLESIFREEVPCKCIRVDDLPIFADSRHVWGPAPDHFIKPYYADFIEQLRNLVTVEHQVK